MTGTGSHRGSRSRTGVVIADDHPIYRDGLAQAIKARADLQLLAQAADGKQALDRLRELRPQVATIDIRMPDIDGLRVLRAASRDAPETRVLVLSAIVDGEVAYGALAEGAAGFISKELSRAEICDAISTVAQGGVVLSPEIEIDLAGEIKKRTRAERSPLTDREIEILRMVASGDSAAAIGDRLHLSPTTVKAHLRNIYPKLGVHDRAAAVAEAMRQGLLD